MKIIEWNINHRFGYSRNKMPEWIKDVIQEKNADIIILTETSFKVPNWEEEYCKLFDRKEYYVFCSSNTDVGSNEVSIAVKKEHFKVNSFKSFLSEGHTYPDHLEIRCTHKATKKDLVIVGVRIHAMNISNQQKKSEFETVLESVKNDENVIISGDFNNYRRGFKDKDNTWDLSEVKKISEKNGFYMYTPDGGSIYTDNRGDYSFPEDHIFTKGKSIELSCDNYDRDFVEKDKNVYKWGKDFQKYVGKDKNGNIDNENVEPPFPDHAILEAFFDIK